MSRCGIANAFETFALEEPRQEARLAGHCRAIVGICEEHALLRREPLRKNADVRNRSCNCRDPGGVYERKSQHLGKDGRVIRMPDVAKRSSGHHAEARRISDLNIPMYTQRPNDPRTDHVRGEKLSEHRRSEPRKERTPEEDNLQSRPNQHGGVQEHHPAESWLINFCRAPCGHLFLMLL